MGPTTSRAINDDLEPSKRPRDILDGLQFWAKTTPDAVAVRFPSSSGDGEYKDLTWGAWLRAIEYLAPQLIKPLALQKLDKDKDTVVTIIIRSSQDVLVPYLALSALGVSVQFISILQPASVVKELLKASGSRRVLSDDLKDAGCEGLDKASGGLTWYHLPSEWRLEALLSASSTSQASTPSSDSPTPALWSRKPTTIIYAHTSGTTSTPKVCPIPLASANMTAMGAAAGWWQDPMERRVRIQLLTALPFHVSFQVPLWQCMICGIAIALPRLSSHESRPLSLLPNATQVLTSLTPSGSDSLYTTPSLLYHTVALASKENKVKVLSSLKGICTVGASITDAQAKQFREAALTIVQSFGSTETGVLYLGSTLISGGMQVLQPLPYLIPFLVYEPLKDDKGQPLPESELYILQGFPSLSPSSLTYTSLPSDPSKKAYRTKDTFLRLPPSPSFGPALVKFVGRTDDRIRLADGVVIRALEVEEAFSSALTKYLGEAKLPSAITNVAALGHGRSQLYLIVELNPSSTQEDSTLCSALGKAVEQVNKDLFPARSLLRVQNVLLTDEKKPLETTAKGNLVRGKVEQTWRQTLDKKEKGGA